MLRTHEGNFREIKIRFVTALDLIKLADQITEIAPSVHTPIAELPSNIIV